MSIPQPDWVSPCGRVTLYCGDCLEILPHLGKVDAVVTDPPYGIGFAGQPTKWQRLAGMEPQEWDDARLVSSQLLAIKTKVGASRMAVWGGNYWSLPVSRGWLAWAKPDAPPSMGNIEFCWTNLDKCAKHIIYSISATNGERVGHPTQKPLWVMIFTLEYLGGKLILDPFMGSGTTGVACIKTGRRFVGIEISRDYFEIAKRRIEQAIEQQQGGPLFKAIAQEKLFQEAGLNAK